MTTLYSLYNWRLASSLIGLENGSLPAIELPPPTQFMPRDYTVKTSNSQGSTGRQGHLNYQLLWTKLDDCQADTLWRILAAVRAGAGLLYVTGLWWDLGSVAATRRRWVDFSGYPDIADRAASPPFYASGVQVYENVDLTLNNLTIINDPSSYS